MSLSTLESLPTEILQQICEYLHCRRRYSPLSAFTRASKACHAASVSCLCHTVRLRLRNSRQFATDLQKWDALLRRVSGHRHVRCLKVHEEKDPESFEPDVYVAEHFDLLDSDDEFNETPQRSPRNFVNRTEDDRISEDHATAWPVLVQLIDKLPGLLDYHHDCPTAPSTCVLQALQRQSCRLHLEAFLFSHEMTAGARAPQELSLLCNRLLRTIKTRSIGYAGDGDGEYTHEAILNLLQGFNTAISHAVLMTETLGARPSIFPAIEARKPRSPWLGFSAPAPSNERSALRYFELGGSGPLYMELVDLWTQRCDVSKIRCLKLRVPYTHLSLAWLPCHAVFASLTTLVLGQEDNLLQGPESGTDMLAALFLASLRPLQAIRFMSEIDAGIFEATLKHHGPSLKRLCFSAPSQWPSCRKKVVPFRLGKVKNLQQRCSVLEDLAITISRSKGDTTEVAIYRTLGAMPKLQMLALTLDCDDPHLDPNENGQGHPAVQDTFDELDMEFLEGIRVRIGGHLPRKGHARDAMINTAVDANLARSIFSTMANAKPAEGALPLACVVLRPARGDYNGECDWVTRQLGKWWIAERYGSSNNVTVTPIRYPGDVDGEEYPKDKDLPLMEEMESIFRRVWPEKTGYWRTDWHSWPLAI